MLVTGAVTALALLSLLWRSWQLDVQLQRTELERARLAAERILQQATRSREVFDAVPEALRLEVRGGRAVADERVGWIEPAGEAVDRDLVVSDRLERAARAEFVDRDHAAAQREFAELLAGPLIAEQRLRVLAAAAWQARRHGAAAREQDLRRRLTEELRRVQPSQLAGPAVSRAVASAAQLDRGADGGGADGGPPRELLTYLPPVPFAALAVDDETRASQRARTELRDRMLLADACLVRLGPTAATGLHAIDAQHVLWLEAERDGARRAAVLTPSLWFDAVRAAAERGATFDWPDQVSVEFAAADAPSPLGVPGVAGLGSGRTLALGAFAWLLPALTGLLALVFVFVFFQQRRAARREAAAIRAQAQFLTTVTHELKTPLAGIRLLGEMLAEGRAVGKEREYYRLLVGESARLSLLIDNVLDLGRLERGERAYRLQPVPLAEVVRETLAVLQPVLEREGVTVRFDDRAGGGSARVDRDAFVQALVAVLDNARKYGARGGRVDVQVARDGGRLLVQVRDHGDGVPEGEREAVFERFARGAAHAHGSIPGVGIGLYLARSIVRRLGGELACVAPADGPGAEFRFSLQGADPT